jgi:membrane-associated phospholipid phosphatase
VNLLKRIGAAKSPERTSEQTEIAKFWSDFSYTVTPPGHWNQIAQEVTSVKDFSVREKVRLFAMLNITLSDVAIACWDSKYVFNFWRPVTAIRAADTDLNDGTEAVNDWMPLLNTPAFPEYVSGHSAFSAAGAVVLAKFNGSDAVNFSVPSDSLPGKRRSYQSLWKCAEEVSQSRLYGGIHFPSALEGGLTMGRQIAEHVLAGEFTSREIRTSRLSSK